MKRRSSSSKKKPSAADFLSSPAPSPPQFDFSSGGGAKEKKTPAPCGAAAVVSPSPVMPRQQNQVVMSSIVDLKEMICAKMKSIKRHLDRSHSEIVKDIDASHSRLHKRFKIQSQACQHVMDEAEKEYKKMSERITESKESLKASYSEFMAEAQASASRVCKSSIPELSQSFDKALDVLRVRYGATAVI